MFDFTILNLVILLSFTFFIGSLLLSAINEAIAGSLRLRQKNLAKGLEKFLFDPSWKGFVNSTLLKSPHIQILMKEKDRVPAYIPARNFVMALLENVVPEDLIKGKITSKLDMHNIQLLPPDAFKLLDSSMKQLGALDPKEQLREFEKRMEDAYNNSMDRVSGWYKKQIRKIIFILGLILSVGLNIDTIRIGTEAMRDPAKLKKAVDNITSNLSGLEKLNKVRLVDSTDKTDLNSIVIETKNETKELLITYKQTSGYTMGYRNGQDFVNQWKKDFFQKLLGVLITAFALQLGANYWFELMTKAVNIRAVGKKPDENPSTDSGKSQK